MTNTLDSQIDATHTLLAKSYAEALVSVARVTLDYSDAVFVRIAHDEVPNDRDPPEDPSDPYEYGIQAIQNTWPKVVAAFEPADTHIEWGHSANQAARTYRLRENGLALDELLELTEHRINGPTSSRSFSSSPATSRHCMPSPTISASRSIRPCWIARPISLLSPMRWPTDRRVSLRVRN